MFAGRESAQRSHTGRIEPHTSSGSHTDRYAQDTHTKDADIQSKYIEAADPQDEYAKDADCFMKAMDQAIAKRAVLPPDCPCHAPTLQLCVPINGSDGEHDPLSRFLAERSSEQSACFVRMDTGTLSISRDCICGRLVEQAAAAGQSAGS